MEGPNPRKGGMKVVSLSAFHSITIELHGGMLALAAFCIIMIIWNAVWKRTLGKKTKRFSRFFAKAAEYAEPTAYLAAAGGIIGLVLSSITGYLIVAGSYNSASEALINSPITMNKIMVSIIALELWIVFVAVRSWYGPKLWKAKPLARAYMMIGLSAFGFTMIAGSMGGHMTGKGSILDPMLHYFGITYNDPWVLGQEAAYFILVIVNIFLVSYTIFYIYSNRLVRRKPVEDLENIKDSRWRNGR
jgi:hypothetical protein